jgi:hypothetical protein
VKIKYRNLSKVLLRTLAFTAAILSFTAVVYAVEGPHGLLLRKGLVTWQMSLAQARPMVEENIRPKTMQLLANQKPDGFGCRQQSNGITQCTWACCVDLGEPDTVHFSTLWFYKDQFYAYSVNFNTNQFPRILAALTQRLGQPSRSFQDTKVNLGIGLGGPSTYIVNTQRWDAGDVIVLLSDRGGGILAGQLYATYMPLERQANPPKEQAPAPAPKLPF